jgi:hypothetical protein
LVRLKFKIKNLVFSNRAILSHALPVVILCEENGFERKTNEKKFLKVSSKKVAWLWIWKRFSMTLN